MAGQNKVLKGDDRIIPVFPLSTFKEFSCLSSVCSTPTNQLFNLRTIPDYSHYKKYQEQPKVTNRSLDHLNIG